MYGVLLASLGRGTEASREARRARTLDPLCLVVGTSAAWVNYLGGDYHSAIEQCGMVIEMDPRFLRARRVLAVALLESGHPREAIIELERALELGPDDPLTTAWLAHARAAAGDAAHARGLAARAVANEGRHVPSYHIAFAHLAAGDREAALSSLERAPDECDPAVVYTAKEPRFAPLHGEPRFQQLLARLNLKG